MRLVHGGDEFFRGLEAAIAVFLQRAHQQRSERLRQMHRRAQRVRGRGRGLHVMNQESDGSV